MDLALGDRRPSWHDIALLGTVLAGVAFYATRLDGGNVVPSFLRFYDVAPGRTYPAALPQDKALLLLTDPATEPSREVAAVGPSIDPLWNTLLLVGIAAALGGAFLAYADR